MLTKPEKDSENSFGNHFLIALGGQEEDYFTGTVSYLVDHSDEGAFGLVINRPLHYQFSELFADVEGAKSLDVIVYDGGPVARDSLFFLHSSDKDYDSTKRISENLCLTTSMDLVHAIIDKTGPEQVIPLLGYAGWAPGQLENELKEDFWLLSPASNQIIFSDAQETKAHAAAALLGVDLTLLLRSAGHG